MAVAALAGLTIALAGAGWTTTNKPPQPARLVFAEQVHDFGRVRQGDMVEVEFAFANRGDVDLSLSAPRVACDCSAEVSPRDEVAPGAGGALRVRFDTGQTDGVQERTVTLYSNDPERRSVMLTLRGEVELDVVADPPALYVGSVTPGTRIDPEPRIRTGAETTAVHAALSDGPYLNAALAGDPHAPALALQIRPDAPAGPFTQTVRVLTSSERHPTVEIPVRGIIITESEPWRWTRD